MAAQRIVVTSPWKLGLFVFLLVVGAGFGLIYAWIRLFGGELHLDDPAWVKNFYFVCGGVAGLGLIGYLAVITSARPLEGVMRGGKRREKLLRNFGHIETPTDADPEDYDQEPALRNALQRWQDDHLLANSAGGLRQAVAHLAERVRSLPSGESLAARDGDVELGQLVAAINDQLSAVPNSAPSAAPSAGVPQFEAPSAPVAPAAPAAAAQDTWRSVGSALLRRQGQLSQMVHSIRSAAQQLVGGGATRVDESAARLGELRQKLEALAEESNRLAIQAALHVSRLGTDNAELVQVTEAIRSVSTRYQRLVPDLRLCENDIESMRAGGSSTGAQIAEALEGGASGLQEIADDIQAQIHALSGALNVALEQPSAAVSPMIVDVSVPSRGPSRPVEVAEEVADAPQAAEPVDDVMDMADLGGEPVEEDVMEMDALGARELDAEGEPIYDLMELGAVQI